jgi:hypothetical protein
MTTMLIQNKEVDIDNKKMSFEPLLQGFTKDGYTMNGEVYHTYVISYEGFQCMLLARNQEEAMRLAIGIVRWREAEEEEEKNI